MLFLKAIPDPKGKLPVERLVPCLHCASLDKKYYFTVDQCIMRSNESDSIWCPSHEGEVDLKCLAPDVLFADIDGKYVLEDGDIEIKDKTKNVLDGGSFGTVYQTQCKGNRNVAVKVLMFSFSVIFRIFLFVDASLFEIVLNDHP